MKKRKMFTKVAAGTLAVCMVGTTALSGNVPVNVLAADAMDNEWQQIQDVVGRYYGEWKDTTYPGLISDTMPDTALLGNGDVGVASAGNADSKSFYISKGDFWTYKGNPLPIGGVTIKQAEKKDEVDEGVNIAPTYKTVTSNNNWEHKTYGVIFKAEDAVDGIMNEVTGISGMYTSNVTREPVWLQLEFEEPVNIARYVVKGDGALRPGCEANNSSAFKLQYSDTGEEGSWKDADDVTNNTESVYDKNLDTPFEAKYVRLYVTGALQQGNTDPNPRVRIGEFELYAEAKGQKEENVNLALQKPVEVSSQWSGEALGTLVDGNDTTQWTSSASVQNAPEHWAIIDLGEEKNIGSWVMKNNKVEAGCVTSDFKLQYSNDKSSWTDFVDVKGNTKTVIGGNLDTPVTGRYVRLSITKGTQRDNQYARVLELELYENPVEIEEEAPFYEKQDILNAEIQTSQKLNDVPTEMKTWISSDKNVMVTELKSNASKDEVMEVETWATTTEKNKKPITAESDEDSVTVTRTTANDYKDDAKSHTSKAALSTKIIGADDVVTSSDNETGKGKLEFTLEAGETIYVVTAIGGGGRTYHNDGSLWEDAVEPEADADALLAEVKTVDHVEKLNADRLKWWKDYWSASYVDFGTEDEKLNQIQKYYYGAQYILGSTIREDKIAPGLYGVWHTNDNAKWGGDYHMNYNFMSTFYGVNSSNRPEQMLPGAQAIFDYVSTAEENASTPDKLKLVGKEPGKWFFSGTFKFVEDKMAKGDIDPEKGIEGAMLMPVGIGPWGMTIAEQCWNETSNASYNSYLFTEYLDYTKDEKILEQSYDYLKKCAAFYESWLEEEDGVYNLYAGWCEGSWSKNPAIELAAVENVFRNLIAMSKELDRDKDKLETWEKIYQDISRKPTWEIDNKTVYGLAEERYDSQKGDGKNYYLSGARYSNILTLDYFLPGGGMGYFSTPEELQVARNTLEAFDVNGGNNTAWNNANNFPRVYSNAVRARYDIEQVIDKFAGNISRSMAKNLRIVDGAHGVEKSGATETVNSMLLASDKGITKVFPNWLADKDAKFANLRAKGAFTVSAEYDGTAQEAKNVSVTSEKGETMTLVSPWAEGAHVLDSEGNVVEVTTGKVPNWEDTENMTITFDTVAGETYTVEKGLVDDGEEDADKADLAGLIDYANSQKDSEDYKYVVPVVKKAFEKALAEAVAVNEKADATQAEVDAAYDNLLEMVHMLGFTGNSESLKVLADSARGMNPDLFTEETWAVLEDALAKAEAVLANENALQDEIDAARDALQDAMDGLVRVPVDKDALKKLIDKAQKYVDRIDQYTDGTAKIFTDMLAEAVATYENEDASQKMVDAAYAELQQAIFQLRLKPNKDKLDDLIKAAEKVDTSKYTDESAAAFKAALDNAKAVFADGEATKEEVKAAEKALKEAQKNLVAKADKVASNDGNKDNKDDKAPVKTGDAATVWTMLLGCMAAVITAGTVVIRRKRR